MSRYDEINISGWWTINFMGNYDGIGCVICNIKEDKNYIPECVGDKKYLFQLNDKHYITKYKFRDAIGIVNQNEIKKTVPRGPCTVLPYIKKLLIKNFRP